MAYVVTENCKGSKWTDCVEVCPADAFFEMDDMLVISADDCIDCDKCVTACPVSAIYPEDDVPDNLSEWVEFNAENAERLVSEGADAIVDKLDEPYAGAEDKKKELGF